MEFVGVLEEGREAGGSEGYSVRLSVYWELCDREEVTDEGTKKEEQRHWTSELEKKYSTERSSLSQRGQDGGLRMFKRKRALSNLASPIFRLR